MSPPIRTVTPRRCCVGIDVAKDSFQAANWPGTDNISFAYDAAGIKALREWLESLTVDLIVLEATGGYQRRLVAALAAAGFAVVVANPRQIRDFGNARGNLAKSDPLDARLIADFAYTLRPQVRPLPPENQQRLTALVARRTQLVAMRTQELNRLGQVADRALTQSLNRTLKQLAREIEKIEALIESALQACPAQAAKVAALEKCPGVGQISSVALVATLPEMGTLTGRQITALAGLAPYTSDSGTYSGPRHIWGGRAAARCTLYMVALTRIRSAGPMRTFYQNLLARGKKKKVALTAVMRKVLVQLNAIVRDAMALAPKNQLKIA
jgi:transposase